MVIRSKMTFGRLLQSLTAIIGIRIANSLAKRLKDSKSYAMLTYFRSGVVNYHLSNRPIEDIVNSSTATTTQITTRTPMVCVFIAVPVK